MRIPEASAGHANTPDAVVAHGRAATFPRSILRAAACAGLLATGLALAGCQTDGPGMASGNGALAFVSIDGPPKPTFDKLVSNLSSEAESRRMKMASKTDPNAYRVKGYLSMHVDRGKASVAYAWDVYDPARTRVARVAGEEALGRVKGAGSWATVDDAALAKVAERSMAELSEALGTSRSGTTAATPQTPADAAPAAIPAEPADAEVPVADAPGAVQPLAYASN